MNEVIGTECPKCHEHIRIEAHQTPAGTKLTPRKQSNKKCPYCYSVLEHAEYNGHKGLECVQCMLFWKDGKLEKSSEIVML